MYHECQSQPAAVAEFGLSPALDSEPLRAVSWMQVSGLLAGVGWSGLAQSLLNFLKWSRRFCRSLKDVYEDLLQIDVFKLEQDFIVVVLIVIDVQW